MDGMEKVILAGGVLSVTTTEREIRLTAWKHAGSEVALFNVWVKRARFKRFGLIASSASFTVALAALTAEAQRAADHRPTPSSSAQ